MVALRRWIGPYDLVYFALTLVMGIVDYVMLARGNYEAAMAIPLMTGSTIWVLSGNHPFADSGAKD